MNMKQLNFRALNVINPIIRACTESGIGRPKGLQPKIIPAIFEKRDIICSSNEESDDILAFAIPILQLMKKSNVDHRKARTIILVNNGEEARKIDDYFKKICKYIPLSRCQITEESLIGNQIYMLKQSQEVIIATPENLAELIRMKHADFSNLEIAVFYNLNEMMNSDVEDLEIIIHNFPGKIQMLFFSEVLKKSSLKFAQKHTINPVMAGIEMKLPLSEKIIPHQQSSDQNQQEKDLLIV